MNSDPVDPQADPDVVRRYPDLIAEDADEDLVRLVGDLDAWAEAQRLGEPPPRLRTAIAQLRAQAVAPAPTKPASVRWRSWLPGGLPGRLMFPLPAIVVALVVVLGIAVVPGFPVQAAVHDLPGFLGQRFGSVLLAGVPDAAPPRRSASTPQPVFTLPPIARDSLTQAQQQVPIPIPHPTWLPAGFQFAGAYVSAGPLTPSAPARAVVELFYRSSADPTAGITLHLEQRSAASDAERFITSGLAVSTNAAQPVTVNGQPAVYAHGAWAAPTGPAAPPSMWNAEAPEAMLSGQLGDFTYTITVAGASVSNPTTLVEIAQSLH